MPIQCSAGLGSGILHVDCSYLNYNILCDNACSIPDSAWKTEVEALDDIVGSLYRRLSDKDGLFMSDA